MHLIIVEAPGKIKTISKFLGKDFQVEPSVGHIRGLPSKQGSVRPEENFAMTYANHEDSEKVIKTLVKAAKQADTIYLATDPDREGEAISWHILEVLKEKRAIKDISHVKRVVFNEITKKAVLNAVDHPRDLDMSLVHAQQARQALDYLVGFNLSPILWRKLPGSRSAGRVQSVALRLIVEREQEIDRFVSQEYWDIKAELNTQKGQTFEATLTQLEGKKLEKFDLSSEGQVMPIVDALKTGNYTVKSIERKEMQRKPQPPFMTSTLQQEASRKLGYSPKRTMQIAQKLYEGISVKGEVVGLITYMRTDGVQIAEEAMHATRSMIEQQYGKRYLPDQPRMYKTKAKNAQEAHEAIRPTHVHYTPKDVKPFLDDDQFKLYELIWKRLVASQMSNAVLDVMSVVIKCTEKDSLFRASGSAIKFDGFYTLYRESLDDEQDEESTILPAMDEGEGLSLVELEPNQHFTDPPPRYSEASLVKKLEELGIGRPSTFTTIVSVIQDRQYVRLDKKRFFAEERGRIVTAFLTRFFPRYVEYDFTAALEEKLDLVSDGKLSWRSLLTDFWGDFHINVEQVSEQPAPNILEALNELLADHIFPENKDGSDPRACEKCDSGKLSLKMGRFGAFVACSNYPDCTFTRQITDSKMDDADAGDLPRTLGFDPVTGEAISLRKGPYGCYVQREDESDKEQKPKRVSLPKTTSPADVTLEGALDLLSLPRDVGVHPETNEMIRSNLGRYGPYLHYQGQFFSIPKDKDLLTITVEESVEVIKAKLEKGQKLEPIRIVGQNPKTGKDIPIYDGRYGPYIKFGRLNVTIPKKVKPEDLTLEEALKLIEEKKEKGSKKKTKKGGAS